MSLRFLRLLTFLPLLAAFAGCASNNDCPPPVNMAEYVCLSNSGRLNCPARSLLAYNVQRVADDGLSDSRRLDSLGLVQELYDGDPNILAGLSGVMDDPAIGAELKESLHLFLQAHPPPRTGGYAQDAPGKFQPAGQAKIATR
ncbi:MAG: hypothetical protein HZA50_17390 [Planctomycetes bacterium]|nr:hypothetical protein [Planctomycetota bacterium]